MAGKGRKKSNESAEENNEAAHTIVNRPDGLIFSFLFLSL
jgi:hypothetical protein